MKIRKEYKMDPVKPTAKVELTVAEAQALGHAYLTSRITGAEDADQDNFRDLRDALGLYPEDTIPHVLEAALTWALTNVVVASRTPSIPLC